LITPDDKQLVESLRNGDAEAFNNLFGKYAGRLYAFGIKYLRSKEEAEGLVQIVFMKVWENRKTLKKESSFQAYLFTIAYNNICNIFRKRASQRQYAETLVAEVKGQEPVAADGVDYSSVLEQVNRIIGQLPEQQKIVFLKSRMEGLSSKEIAKELNLSPGTVDNYISGALKFIRARLGAESLSLLLFVSLWIM
jgi:RNA polymerase sigma-70 factor (family 1)